MDPEKKAKKRRDKRRKKYSKQVQKASEKEALRAGRPGAYALRKDRKQDEVKPSKRDKYRSKTKYFAIGGVKKPESGYKQEVDRPPYEPEIEIHRVGKKKHNKQELLQKGKTASETPKSVDGIDTSRAKASAKSQSEKGDTLKRGSEKLDPSEKKDDSGIDAFTAKHGITMPDRLVKTKRRGKKGGGSKMKTVTKYFDKVSEEDYEAKKDKEADRLAEGKDVQTFKRGRKIIEKTSSKKPKATSSSSSRGKKPKGSVTFDKGAIPKPRRKRNRSKKRSYNSQ
jgi:hypothetical protein